MGKEMENGSLLDWLSDFLPDSAAETPPLASPPPVLTTVPPRFTSPPKAPAPAPLTPAQASSPPAQTPERPSSPTSDPIFIAPVPLHSASSSPAQTPEALPATSTLAPPPEPESLVSPELAQASPILAPAPKEELPPAQAPEAPSAPPNQPKVVSAELVFLVQDSLGVKTTEFYDRFKKSTEIVPDTKTLEMDPDAKRPEIGPGTIFPPAFPGTDISPRLPAVPLGRQVSTPPISTPRTSQTTEEEAKYFFMAHNLDLSGELQKMSQSTNPLLMIRDEGDVNASRSLDKVTKDVEKSLKAMKIFEHDFINKKIVFIENVGRNHWEVFVKELGEEKAKHIKIAGDGKCGLTSAIVASRNLTDRNLNKNPNKEKYLDRLIIPHNQSNRGLTVDIGAIQDSNFEPLTRNAGLNDKIKKLAVEDHEVDPSNWLTNDQTGGILEIIENQVGSGNFEKIDTLTINEAISIEKKIHSLILSREESVNFASCPVNQQIIEGRSKSAYGDFSSIFPEDQDDQIFLFNDPEYVKNITKIVKKYLDDLKDLDDLNEPNQAVNTERKEKVQDFIKSALASRNFTPEQKKSLKEGEKIETYSQEFLGLQVSIDQQFNADIEEALRRSLFIRETIDKIDDQISFLSGETVDPAKINFNFLKFDSEQKKEDSELDPKQKKEDLQKKEDFFSDKEGLDKWKRFINVCFDKLPNIKKELNKESYNELVKHLRQSISQANEYLTTQERIDFKTAFKRKFKQELSLPSQPKEDSESLDKKNPKTELAKYFYSELEGKEDEFIKMRREAFKSKEALSFRGKIDCLIEKITADSDGDFKKLKLTADSDGDFKKLKPYFLKRGGAEEKRVVDEIEPKLLDILTPDEFKEKPRDVYNGWGEKIEIRTDLKGETRLFLKDQTGYLEVESIMVEGEDKLKEIMQNNKHDLIAREVVHFFRTQEKSVNIKFIGGEEKTLEQQDKKFIKADEAGNFKDFAEPDDDSKEKSELEMLKKDIEEGTGRVDDSKASKPSKLMTTPAKNPSEMKEEAQKIMNHIKERFDQLEVLLRDNIDENSDVKGMVRAYQQNVFPAAQDQQQPKTKTKLIIVIPGDENGRIGLGTGLAVGQWKEWAKQAGYQEKYGEIHHEKMIDLIKTRVERLKEIDKLHGGGKRAGHLQFGNVGEGVTDFSAQFPIGKASLQDFVDIYGAENAKEKLGVSGVAGEVTNIENFNVIHVWGANAKNWNEGDQERIGGGGQASAMGTQKEGVFGIVTTPIEGFKDMEAEKCKTYGGTKKAVSDTVAKSADGVVRVGGGR